MNKDDEYQFISTEATFFFNSPGPLTEVNLPVDPLTKKIKGFAFITFMMPEHAVKAFTELDGTTFQVNNLRVVCAIAELELMA